MPSALKVSELIEFLRHNFDPDRRLYIHTNTTSAKPFVDPSEMFVTDSGTYTPDIGPHVRVRLTYSPNVLLPADAKEAYAQGIKEVGECISLVRRKLAVLETTLSEIEVTTLSNIKDGPLHRLQAAMNPGSTVPTPTP